MYFSGSLEGMTRMKNCAEKSINEAIRIIGEAILGEQNDLYKILGVCKTVESEQLQTAVDKLRNLLHFNTDPSQTTFCGDVLKRIEYANLILTDAQLKLLYDTFIHTPLNLITGNPKFENIMAEVDELKDRGLIQLLDDMLNMSYHKLLGVNLDFTTEQINDAYNRITTMIDVIAFNETDEKKIEQMKKRAKEARNHYLRKRI